ncbi:MAG TPA: hypothetical protein VMK30_00705 [Pleomorphomonadaceae bacterium]|nr:hypothetical protein [Pleomorphomonadaceae bacterium]
MSMTTRAHPDPERLAALAGADPDALSDRELSAHVAECAVCDGQLRELRVLRAALAELPDLVPSRPLRLLPPVPESTPSAGWRIGLRRAFAPLAVAGMVLLLVGGVGATGALGPADAGAFLQRIQFSAPAAIEAATAQPQETAAEVGMAPDEVASPEGSRGQTGAIATDVPRAADATAAPAESLAEVTAGQDTSRDGDLAMVEDRLGWILAALAGVGLLALALVLRRSAVPIDRGSSGR